MKLVWGLSLGCPQASCETPTWASTSTSCLWQMGLTAQVLMSGSAKYGF